MPDGRPRPAPMTLRRWTGVTLLVGGGLTLAVWLVAPAAMDVVLLGGSPPAPATAACFVLLGLVLARPSDRIGPAVLAALAVVAAVGGLSIGAYVVGRPSVFAHTLFPDAWLPYAGAHSGGGSLAPGTAAGLLAVVAALLVAGRSTLLANGLGFLAFGAGYVALLGHVYGVSHLYELQSATAMPPLTGGLLVVASVGAATARTGMRLQVALAADGTAGLLVCRLLPWTLVLPPVAGFVHLTGERRDWYSAPFGIALLMLAWSSALVLAVLGAARMAGRVDRGRSAASAELAGLNAELAERVAAATAQVRAEQQRVAVLLDSSPVGIFETGADGVRRYVNQRWRELTGVLHDEPGDDWWAPVHPEDRPRVREELARNMAQGQEYGTRYRYARDDGTAVWVDTTVRPLYDAAGVVTGWLGCVTDVSRQVEAQRRLEDSESRYRSVVSALVEGVLMQDRDGAVTAANGAAGRILARPPESLTGARPEDLFTAAVREDGSPMSPDQLPSARALRDGVPVRDVTVGLQRPDGTVAWLRVNAVPLGGAQGVVTTFADVTERLRGEAALRRSEQQFRLSMTNAPIGMARVSLDGRLLEVNEALARLTGYSVPDLLGTTMQSITHAADLEADAEPRKRLLDGVIESYTAEKRYLRRGGEVVWVQVWVSLVREEDGAPAYLITQMQDVSAARAEQAELEHRALHDPLTGLANRELVHEHLRHGLARARRSGLDLAVLFCDLDRFKEVNDTHGHQAGDTVLRVVAERLLTSVRPSDTVGRLGGDEFVVVIEGVEGPAVVGEIVARIEGELHGPIDIGGGTSVLVGVSVGVAHGADRDAAELIWDADVAMYGVKRAKRADRAPAGA